MTLPTIETPTYTLSLPSSGDTIEYRPFLMKEEKILLMAVEGNSEKESVKALKQVLKNCVLTDININELPLFDLEYIFIHLRSKSVGEKIELQFNCNNTDCNHTNNIKVDLTNIEILRNKNHNNKIELTPTVGLFMKYPSFNSFINNFALQKSINTNNFFDLLIDCIDSIYDETQVYSHKDITRQELVMFVEKLTQEQSQKIKVFFDTMPKIQKDLTFVCKKCEHENKILLENFSDFFGVDSLMSP